MHLDNYTWEKSRKRRTIALMIGSQGELIVKSPVFTSKKVIESFIKTKASWILSQQERQKNRIHPELPIFKKEGFLYALGVRMPFVCIDEGPSKVIEEDEKIVIYAKNERLFNKSLTQWYRKKTADMVDLYLNKYLSMLTVQPLSVGYKRYRRKWGSCDHKNNLMFNILLSAHPCRHIEYVVVHELCHIKEKHHKASFWRHGEELLPEFRKIHKDML
ncbi:MAG: M48 family metallopeptidase [Thiovulaceae bacterium]|nr:M48 family metallopeptidase [Sulfurimonadaceae bacterium]